MSKYSITVGKKTKLISYNQNDDFIEPPKPKISRYKQGLLSQIWKEKRHLQELKLENRVNTYEWNYTLSSIYKNTELLRRLDG